MRFADRLIFQLHISSFHIQFFIYIYILSSGINRVDHSTNKRYILDSLILCPYFTEDAQKYN